MRVTEIDGLPVIDATEPLALTVGPRDIKGASRKEPGQCAIARACRRQLHVHEVRIHLSRTYLRTNSNNWVRYVTPKSARDEIIAFDRGGEFEPVQLTLSPVWKSERLGAGRSGGKPTGNGVKREKPRVVTNVRGGPA